MTSWTRSSGAGRLGAYGLTVPAVGLGLWAALLVAGTDARPLAATPLALAVALSASYGGSGPGLFALVQAVFAIEFLLIGPGTLFRTMSGAQAAALAAFVGGWLAFCVLTGRGVRQSRTDQERRLAAEAGSAHAGRLVQLTAALAQARTPRAAIEAAVQESLHALQADAGALLLVSRDGQLAEVARRVGYPGREPSTEPVDEGPISDAVDRGRPVISSSRAARAADYPSAADWSRDPFRHRWPFTARRLPRRRRRAARLHAPRALTPDDRAYSRRLFAARGPSIRTWQLEVSPV
jgi:hypothetical protein